MKTDKEIKEFIQKALNDYSDKSNEIKYIDIVHTISKFCKELQDEAYNQVHDDIVKNEELSCKSTFDPFKGSIPIKQPRTAFLFSFNSWHSDPNKYILVHARNEQEAREIGCKQCRFNSKEIAKPSDLELVTYGL